MFVLFSTTLCWWIKIIIGLRVTGVRYCCTAAAHNIELSPYVGVYRVDETITCTARGYPEPSVHWQSADDPASIVVDGPVLRLTDSMIGRNNWICLATNGIGSIRRPHAFRVIAGLL